jgi:hypothetical protein
MIVPFVVAFSASCSTKSTLAPRPATSEGSRAARVTTGAEAAAAEPVPTARVSPKAVAAVAATPGTTRDGRLVRLEALAIEVRNIATDSFGGALFGVGGLGSGDGNGSARKGMLSAQPTIDTLFWVLASIYAEKSGSCNR